MGGLSILYEWNAADENPEWDVCFIYDDSCSCCCSLGLKDMWGAVSTAWSDWGFSSRRCPNSGGRICFIIIGFHLLQRIPPSGRQRWDKAAWTNRHIVVGLQTSHFVVLKFIPTKFKGFFSLKAFNHLIYWVVITGWFSSWCSSSAASSGNKSGLGLHLVSSKCGYRVSEFASQET